MPILYVIAGPNGIGKTTSSYDLVPANVPIINSDEIAKEIRNSGILAANTNTQEYSNNEASRLIQEHLEKRVSFAIETNLADDHTWKFLIETQKSGYKLHVIYVSTDDLEILNRRIEARVKQGDHYVRPDIVKERYMNGLALLRHYFNIPDHLQLFDNSQTSLLKAEAEFGQIISRAESLPEWISSSYGAFFNDPKDRDVQARDLKTKDEVRALYRKGNNSAT
jgi:predicted ABC-type ATPase